MHEAPGSNPCADALTLGADGDVCAAVVLRGTPFGDRLLDFLVRLAFVMAALCVGDVLRDVRDDAHQVDPGAPGGRLPPDRRKLPWRDLEDVLHGPLLLDVDAEVGLSVDE